MAAFRDVKGHRHLIDACARLRDRGLSFRCHLVGDGPLRGALERQIRDQNLRDHFVLHGALARPDVVRHMQAAVFRSEIKERAGASSQGAPR